MAATDAQRSLGATSLVDPETIRIGADVLELLTSGMYVSPITVYREYVQNSADSIDAARSGGLLGPQERGKVTISIDHALRAVTIRDNGTGVPAADVSHILLAIGASAKRGTAARGFRGVGRLSGLAYCRELEFRTKAVGEAIESTIIWDARALRSGINAVKTGLALQEVVASAVKVTTVPSQDRDAHFFEVTLRDVARHRQDILLNERAIAEYLGQVAPVPFSADLSFASAITERLTAASPTSIPIELTVADHTIERPYRDALTQPGTPTPLILKEIEFFELADVDGEVGAIGWLAHHDYVRSISTTLGVRGLRARAGDIQIGDAGLFDNSFREARFNGWTIGEVHILDRRLVPNGRRDDFEVNHHSYNLLVQLGPIAARVSHRCRTSSINRNASLIIRNLIAEADELLATGNTDRLRLSRTLAALQRARQKLKSVTDDELRSEFTAELARLEAELSAKRPSDKASLIASDEAVALISRIVTNRAQANQLIAELLRLQS